MYQTAEELANSWQRRRLPDNMKVLHLGFTFIPGPLDNISTVKPKLPESLWPAPQKLHLKHSDKQS